MTELNSRDRIAYWDNAKGILICLVVFGHFLYSYQDNLSIYSLVSIIYFFHIPAFVLISGYFSQNAKTSGARYIIKLAAAYLIFNTVMMIYSVFVDRTLLTLIQPYNSYWYLVALIVWRLSVKYIAKIKGIVTISIIVALLIGFWGEITNVFALSRIICFFPFFLIGYKLPIDKVKSFINNRKRMDYLKGTLILIITLGVAFFCVLFFYPTTDIFVMSAYTSPGYLIDRIIIFAVAALMILSMALLVPGKPVPVLSKWGKNSLAIYVMHRLFALVFARVFPPERFTPIFVLFATVACAVTLFILGQDVISAFLNFLLGKFSDIVLNVSESVSNQQKRIFKLIMVFIMVVILTLPITTSFLPANDQVTNAETGTTESASPIYPVISDKQSEEIKNAVSLAFVGDLTLLEDQVKKAYSEKTGEYDFTSEFAYASKYLSSADLAIGVLEGPTAGETAGYSTGNFDDGIPLSLNFPDSFVSAIKNAGIDFVTTSDNHLLDKGQEGAMRTLDVLDSMGLKHTGSYRDEKEKNDIQLLNVKGLKIAVLSYTFGINGNSEDELLKEHADVSAYLVDETSPNFETVKNSVLGDFARVKESNPDVIIVLPHMGTQFIHETDAFQKTWNDIFISAGANIILGDHSHDVQPIEFCTVDDTNGNEKTAVIVNCTGNFVDSFTKYDGDATAITQIYLDPATGGVICAGIVPMWTQSSVTGVYKALPIYDIMTDTNLQEQISSFDMGRVKEVQATVTSVMIGASLTLDQTQKQYYFFPEEGYVRQPSAAIPITDKMTGSELYKTVNSSKKICFVGDSLTQGSKNGGYGWYEPLMEAFPEVTVSREAWDGATTKTLIANASEIAAQGADTYVIAIGTNDVRYRDKNTCAMDADQFIANINSLVKKITEKNKEAQFVFICPWLALDNDPYEVLSTKERDAMLAAYGESLKQYCYENKYIYVDPNPAIRSALSKVITTDYLLDSVCPTAGKGIDLYSQAVLNSGIS